MHDCNYEKYVQNLALRAKLLDSIFDCKVFMNLIGWTYTEDKLPWTKVFDCDIAYDKNFSNVPAENLCKMLMQCDIDGYVKSSVLEADAFFNNMLDTMFRVYGINFKYCNYDNKDIMYNGKIINYYVDKDVIDSVNESYANVTLINMQYVYFNCTSYGFYKPILPYIFSTFASTNLGGDLVKLGLYPELDKFLKNIL